MEPNYINSVTLIAQITQAGRDLFAVDQSIDTIEGRLAAEVNNIETQIAYDKRYSNDAQRKLARYELQEASVLYKQWSSDLADQKLEKQSIRNNIDELRLTLSAMQLEIRRGIVQQETANLERIELQ